MRFSQAALSTLELINHGVAQPRMMGGMSIGTVGTGKRKGKGYIIEPLENTKENRELLLQAFQDCSSGTCIHISRKHSEAMAERYRYTVVATGIKIEFRVSFDRHTRFGYFRMTSIIKWHKKIHGTQSEEPVSPDARSPKIHGTRTQAPVSPDARSPPSSPSTVAVCLGAPCDLAQQAPAPEQAFRLSASPASHVGALPSASDALCPDSHVGALPTLPVDYPPAQALLFEGGDENDGLVWSSENEDLLDSLSFSPEGGDAADEITAVGTETPLEEAGPAANVFHKEGE